MKVLVTGAGGFIGTWLVRALNREGAQVTTLVRRPPPWRAEMPQVRVREADIRDAAGIADILQEERPQWIFHLAALSLVGPCWERPWEACDINILGTVHLLEAMRRTGFTGRLILACSSAEYAAPAQARPIREDGRLWPSSIYGMTKFSADAMGRLYAEQYGLDIVRVRPFFLIGPGKTGDVASDFARGIVAVERGDADELEVGNLDVVRDFVDVRDGVSGFLHCARAGEKGNVYNLCSGRGMSIRDLLDRFLAQAHRPVRVVVSPRRVRVQDEPYKVGDPGRLKSLGWSPAIPLERTVADILDYWRDSAG